MKGVRIRMKFGNHNVIKTISNITRYLSVYTGEIWTPRDKWQIGWHNWKKYRRGGGGGRWLEGMIFKMEVEKERTSQKRKFSGGGGRIGKFDQEECWSEKKSPDLRSPEVGISDTHCGISRVGMLSSLYQHVVE